MVPDPYDDPGWKAFAADAKAHLLPALRETAVTAMAWGGEGEISIQGALELGMSLLMGKPLVVVATSNDEIPKGLRAAADLIIIGDADNPVQQAAMQAQIGEFLTRLRDE